MCADIDNETSTLNGSREESETSEGRQLATCLRGG